MKCFDGICQERTHSTATVSCSVHNMFGTCAIKSCKISDKMMKMSGRVKWISLVQVIIIFFKILDLSFYLNCFQKYYYHFKNS